MNIYKFLTKCSLLKIAALFVGLAFLLRGYLLFRYQDEVTFNFVESVKIILVGLTFDTITAFYFIWFAALYYLIIPRKLFPHSLNQNFIKIIYFIFLLIVIFAIFAEIVFFDEFNARFNFIAIDYLIYTTEVIGNIIESYPLPILLTIITIISAIIYYFSVKKIIHQNVTNLNFRLKYFSFITIILILDFYWFNNQKLERVFLNNYNKEIAQNGIYQLFSAYRNNKIDYEKFYLTRDTNQALNEIRKLISKQEPYTKFLNDQNITRYIAAKPNSVFKNYNLMVITLESMSADFMKHFGNTDNLTPNLDQLAEEGLFFTNLKATGTRTVRGLEAISLSVPPTPGNSIVRRPHNENLFNILTPLQIHNYEGKFIYGGDGYFDNMNYFFANNGFMVIDRKKFSNSEITFSNAWGVADEDLYNKTIAEADKSFTQNKPFLNFVMTTSNHRPFTYPANKIDIPSKTSRNGAVKYADYALGQFIKNSKDKPWFKNTIFLFIADHCAGSAGNTDVPLWRYQIPAIFYAPHIIKPQIYSDNASQIDIAPTLLGLLNLSYQSSFFGVDLLRANKKYSSRAFVSTYTDLGYFSDDKLYLLKLNKNKKIFEVELKKYGYQGSIEKLSENYSKLDEENLKIAINYYQIASYLFAQQQNSKF